LFKTRYGDARSRPIKRYIYIYFFFLMHRVATFKRKNVFVSNARACYSIITITLLLYLHLIVGRKKNIYFFFLFYICFQRQFVNTVVNVKCGRWLIEKLIRLKLFDLTNFITRLVWICIALSRNVFRLVSTPGTNILILFYTYLIQLLIVYTYIFENLIFTIAGRVGVIHVLFR